jgi:hypothetical protein
MLVDTQILGVKFEDLATGKRFLVNDDGVFLEGKSLTKREFRDAIAIVISEKPVTIDDVEKEYETLKKAVSDGICSTAIIYDERASRFEATKKQLARFRIRQAMDVEFDSDCYPLCPVCGYGIDDEPEYGLAECKSCGQIVKFEPLAMR